MKPKLSTAKACKLHTNCSLYAIMHMIHDSLICNYSQLAFCE